jgi:hypothetical protein
MHRRWLVVAFLAALVAGCKPKPNDKCSGAGVCQDAHTALVCNGSFRYETVSCNGPDGCSTSPFLHCDYRGNAAGERCADLREGHPQECTPDKKARVSCPSGKVVRDECEGPRGCAPRTEQTMSCDRALRAGASCSADGDWCSDDKADWLECRENKLVAVARCRGPKGCQLNSIPGLGSAIECDVSIAEQGDPCVGKVTGCARDRAAVLECANRKFEPSPCAPGKRCTMREQEARCD